jgi:cyanophycinase-like exopeptidase
MSRPGLIALFGSGETSSQGRKIHDYLMTRLPVPVQVAILETPAGFQPNAEGVNLKIQQFLEKSLQNFRPAVTLVAARRKGSAHDPDDPATVRGLEQADYIFAGPGSPTYTVRHLGNTRAWDLIRERHAAGATLAFSSAAAIAMGAYVLPVYEIYKAGADLGWERGLALFPGLDLAILPHWNNAEGGAGLDTSHCFMGAERFARLHALLPAATTVLGIDEHTACIIDPVAATCLVLGMGTVTVLRDGQAQVFPAQSTFPVSLLGVWENVRLPIPATTP